MSCPSSSDHSLTQTCTLASTLRHFSVTPSTHGRRRAASLSAASPGRVAGKDGIDGSLAPTTTAATAAWWTVRVAVGLLSVLFALSVATLAHGSPWQESPRRTFPSRPRAPGAHSPAVRGCQNTTQQSRLARERAAILILGRDDDLEALLPTLDNFEVRFNGVFNYPYVFLNDRPFSNEFRQSVQANLPKGRMVEFGLVEEKDWSIPDWIGEDRAMQSFQEQESRGIQYAGKESYHHMCRFYSGLFVNHPLLAKYDWYWRLEPGVRFYCDITYDPFRFMALRDLVYGFVITIVESQNTIPTLFQTILDWREKEGVDVKNLSSLWNFFLQPEAKSRGQEEYNLCHFWTNFEIGSLEFFRGQEYQSLFKFLDLKGGFYTERWGDAPVRSLALGLLADFDRVHYFEDFAYKHDWFLHCAPKDIGCNCQCPTFGEGNENIDTSQWYSCLPRWKQLDRAW